jgi:hypothetical protein
MRGRIDTEHRMSQRIIPAKVRQQPSINLKFGQGRLNCAQIEHAQTVFEK